MPTMGTLPMVLDTATISAVFMIGRSYLHAQGYDLNDGGMDTAITDFMLSVASTGLQTLTALPSAGTTPLVGLGGAAITSWTTDAQLAQSYSVDRHANGGQAYAEITAEFICHSGQWGAHTGGGVIMVPIG